LFDLCLKFFFELAILQIVCRPEFEAVLFFIKMI
jgi:hypothetical protein